MTKLLPALLLLAAGACSQQSSTSLADLQTTYGNATLELVALGEISVEMKVQGSGCPLLGDDVEATFDGIPMDVARGGESDTFDGCYPIAFSISKMPVAAAQTFEQSSSGSNLIIADGSTHWTVASTKMFSNDFTVDAANSQVIWQDVKAISEASLVPTVPFTLDGNAIKYPKGTVIETVNAYAHPTPSVCTGPSQCLVDLAGTRDFQPTPPQQ